MKDVSTRRLIVILSMGRCGTSTITRGLKTLGVELGTRLLSPDANNPRGYWEDVEIVGANDDFLRANGYAWHTLRDLDWSALKGREEFTARVRNLLEERLARNSLWGFKDPRTYLLFPLWQEAFSEIEVEPLFLLPLRNPRSIAKSLETRDGFLQERTYYLWLRSQLSTIRHTRGKRRCLISYERVLQDPEREYRRAAEHLGLEIPNRFEKEITLFRNEFLSSSLDHAKYNDGDLSGDERIPAPVKSLYSVLGKVASGELNLDDRDVFRCSQRAETEIAPLEPLFRFMDTMLGENEEMRQKGRRHEARITELEARRAALQGALEEERKWRQWFQAEFHRVEASLGFRTGERIKETLNKYPRLRQTVRGALENILSR